MPLDLQPGDHSESLPGEHGDAQPVASGRQRRVLIMGASYGSLLAARLMAGGHASHLVCRASTAALMTQQGSIVRMPVKGRDGLVEVNSLSFPGLLTASAPEAVDPAGFDLAVLAMQEPQYGQPGVRELLARVAAARIPVMSIMNMPPLPYLARIPGLDTVKLRGCYTDPSVWDGFDPRLMTLCSPDPQAFRPPGEPINVLQVRLATNFKTARFESEAHTAMLRQLDRDIEASRVAVDDTTIELPVKLKTHDSIFVPLAKWAMLMAGNYRCVGAEGMRPIKEAVHSDIATSRAVYEWVADLCVDLGADASDMVPFEKYAQAAQSLASPSSAARALAAGATNIERVDRLVQAVARSRGQRNAAVDATVALVDRWIAHNTGKVRAA